MGPDGIQHKMQTYSRYILSKEYGLNIISIWSLHNNLLKKLIQNL